MSGLCASAILTPYLPTNQRIKRVVAPPSLALAARPASAVSACLGIRYWGRTARRSDTVWAYGKDNRRNYSGGKGGADFYCRKAMAANSSEEFCAANPVMRAK